MITGLVMTAFSFIRSSKIAMYGMVIGAVVIGLLLALTSYGARREAGGATKVVTAMTKKVIENNKLARKKHAEIKRLPMSERAARLRRTDRRSG